ncbi:MAG TPA: GTPase Era [Polyangiaceae bacterium]
MPKSSSKKSSKKSGASRERAETVTRSGTAAIVGRANVGKSTLLNAMIGAPLAITSSKPQTTRDRILGIATEGTTQILFVDTPGLHDAKTKLGARMNHEAKDAAAGADAVLFLTDALKPEPEDVALLNELPKNTILVINKIDRITDKTVLFEALTAYSAIRDFVAIVPISAKTSNGIARVTAEIRNLLPEGPMLYDEEQLTDRPTRFFAAEYVREQVLKKTREEVPHGVAIVIERFDEALKKGKSTIEATIHVDRETHKKIIVGKNGSMLKEIGIAARKRIEHLLGHGVILKLWVRVTPGWYRTDAGLKEMGYDG